MLGALPWPLAVIDFEASSLSNERSYPIEVGLALWPAPGEPVLGWSTLIRPVEEWTRHGHWSPASTRLHGIRGADLVASGWPPDAVAAALNAALGPGRVAWCDGGPYDTHWANRLFKAGKVSPAFALGDWHRLAAKLGPAGRDRALVWLGQAQPLHRARADAERLLLALAHGAGTEGIAVLDLAQRLPVLAGVPTSGIGL